MMDWQKIGEIRLPATISSWLADPGSLTKHCKKIFKEDYHFQLLQETWQEADQHACELLNLKKGESIKVREITQGSHQQTLVYGRSILSQQALNDSILHLDDLGDTSLGSRIFQHPEIKRGTISIKELNKDDELYHHAIPHTKNDSNTLWARYSIFNIKKLKILVYEVFFF